MAMHLFKSKWSFWYLHTGGWLLYFIIDMYYTLGLDFYINRKISITLYFTFTYTIGFVLTAIMRYFYKRINIRTFTLFKVITYVFIISFLSAHLMVFALEVYKIVFTKYAFKVYLDSLDDYIAFIFRWMIPFLGWSMLYFSIKFLIAWNEQKEIAEIADTLAQNARLQMLKYQIDPEFLFKSLENIRDIIIKDKKSAKALITNLSEFLRYSLVSGNKSEAPLKSEIEAITNYLLIKNSEFDEELKTEFNISKSAEDFPVKYFSLHHIIEKLIKYKKSEINTQPELKITADIVEDLLHLNILFSPDSEEAFPDRKTVNNFINDVNELTDKDGSSNAENQKINISGGQGTIRIELIIKEKQ